MSPIRIRRRITFGPLRANLSRAGVSWTIKLGPWSWNSRTHRQTIDLTDGVYYQTRGKARHARGDRSERGDGS